MSVAQIASAVGRRVRRCMLIVWEGATQVRLASEQVAILERAKPRKQETRHPYSQSTKTFSFSCNFHNCMGPSSIPFRDFMTIGLATFGMASIDGFVSAITIMNFLVTSKESNCQQKQRFAAMALDHPAPCL